MRLRVDMHRAIPEKEQPVGRRAELQDHVVGRKPKREINVELQSAGQR
jgi:hypothetical protein